MPQLLVWYCPHENLLFQEKAKYQEHVKELAWHRFHERMSDKYCDRLGWYISKRADHVRTPALLEEFFMDNFQLAHKAVCWGDYKNPKERRVNLKSVKIRYSVIEMNSIDIEMQLHIDMELEVIDDPCWGIMGYHHRLLTTLGLCHYQGSNHNCSYTGKWHLLNEPAHEEYKRQKDAWTEEDYSRQVLAKLKNEHYLSEPFKFKRKIYAKSDGVPVPAHEIVLAIRAKETV